MLVEAVERAGQDGAARLMQRMEQWRAQALRALVETYLSEAHLGGCEGGCPVSSLVSEMPRQSPQLRESGAGRVRGLMNLVRRFLPADARPGAATAVTSTRWAPCNWHAHWATTPRGGRCWPRRARRCCRATNRRVNARRIEGCKSRRRARPFSYS